MKNYFLILLLFFFVSIEQFAANNPHNSDLFWVVTPNSKDWTYNVGEDAVLTFSIYKYGVPIDEIEVNYTTGLELMPADKKGVVKIKNGVGKINIGTLKSSGFKECRLSINIDGKTDKHHIKVGFEPEKIVPYTKLPKDFVSFWESEKAKAEKCPYYIEKTFEPKYSSDKIDCYLVKIQVHKRGEFVYGYLTMPKEKGKYPVVIAPPGAGVKPMDPLKDLFYAENGLIRFDMEIHGIRPDLSREDYTEISRAFGRGNNSYLTNGLDNKDNYYMKKVYLSFNRVIDFLTSLEEWDGKNVIAQGGSQGGALAIVAAALDERVTVCAANHPALSDMAGFKAGRTGGYPHFYTKFNGMDTPEKIETMAYYDVVNFARQLKVPTFITWGFNDDVCPPTTSYAVYNVISSEKEALITPINEHWISATTRREIMNWIKTKLK